MSGEEDKKENSWRPVLELHPQEKVEGKRRKKEQGEEEEQEGGNEEERNLSTKKESSKCL